MMKRLLLILPMALLCLAAATAQRTITGTVADDTGQPLIGANVIIKGTATGTVTDLDGTYSIMLPEGRNTLIFSYTGYATQEVEVGPSNVLDVTLTEGVVLETAVVTALGIERDEKSLGYAVQSLEGDQIQQVAEPDPLRALQGKVAGVNILGSSGAPGSATRITIRGNSSLLGNNQPLIVVDGIPYDNSEYRTNLGLNGGGAYANRMADIDPNNIETINVLRGAAAASLWGSRAANGVIMITTKTGSRQKKGLGVSLSSTLAFEEIANLPDYQNTYGTGTNFNYQQVNGSWGAPFVGTKPYATLTEIPHWYQGRPGFEELDGVMVPYRAYPDNVAKLFQTGVTSDNAITITNGGENTSIGATLSYLNNEGYVPNTRFTRAAFSVGGSAQLSDRFSLSANLNYTRTDQDGVISGVGALGSNNPSAFARSLYLGRNWDVHGQPFQNPVDNGSEFMVGRGTADNPLWSYRNAGFRADVDRIASVLNARYSLPGGFALNYRIGINAYSQRNSEFIRPGSTGPSSNPGVGQVIDHDIAYQEIESNLFLEYETSLSNSLTLNALVGQNLNQTTVDQQAFQGLNYVIFDIDDLDNTNSVVPYLPPDGSPGFQRSRLTGLYSEFRFGFNSWAYLNLSGRNDWSSTLPIDNRSYFYPSASASFSILDALAISPTNIDFVKLRAGWAQVGNDTDPYLLNRVYNVNGVLVTNPAPTISFPFTQTGGSTVPALTLTDIERNPDLKPERTNELEVGLDVRLFGGRVTLDATYYDKRSKDQIATVSVPNSSGFEQYLTNFGEISNKGIEVALGITPFRRENGFTWNTFTTFTRNRNVVESLTEGVSEIQIEQGSSFAGEVITVHRPGQEFGLLLGSVNLRDEEGNLLIDRSNGQLIRAPQPDIIGNPNPDFRLGFVNTFSWKGLSLRAVLDWQQGGDLYSNTVLSLLGRGVTKDTEDREVNVVIPGVYGDPNTLEPVLNEAGEKIPNQTMVEINTLYFGETFAINGANEWAVFDASYLKIRELALSYALPRRLLESTPFTGVSLSLTGRNLWFWAPGFPEHTNFDPEVNQFGSTNKQGIEYSATPTVRRYGVSLKVQF